MSSEAIVVADRDGIIRSWNAEATEFFGHLESEAVGATLDLIVPPHARDELWARYRQAWTGHDAAPIVAMMAILCAGAEVRDYPGCLYPIRGPHGDLAAIAGVWSRPSERDADLPTLT